MLLMDKISTHILRYQIKLIKGWYRHFMTPCTVLFILGGIMKKFESLENGNVSEVNKRQIEGWKKQNIFNKSIDNRSKSNNFVFYDGPATANGNP